MHAQKQKPRRPPLVLPGCFLVGLAILLPSLTLPCSSARVPCEFKSGALGLKAPARRLTPQANQQAVETSTSEAPVGSFSTARAPTEIPAGRSLLPLNVSALTFNKSTSSNRSSLAGIPTPSNTSLPINSSAGVSSSAAPAQSKISGTSVPPRQHSPVAPPHPARVASPLAADKRGDFMLPPPVRVSNSPSGLPPMTTEGTSAVVTAPTRARNLSPRKARHAPVKISRCAPKAYAPTLPAGDSSLQPDPTRSCIAKGLPADVSSARASAGRIRVTCAVPDPISLILPGAPGASSVPPATSATPSPMPSVSPGRFGTPVEVSLTPPGSSDMSGAPPATSAAQSAGPVSPSKPAPRLRPAPALFLHWTAPDNWTASVGDTPAADVSRDTSAGGEGGGGTNAEVRRASVEGRKGRAPSTHSGASNQPPSSAMSARRGRRSVPYVLSPSANLTKESTDKSAPPAMPASPSLPSQQRHMPLALMLLANWTGNSTNATSSPPATSTPSAGPLPPPSRQFVPLTLKLFANWTAPTNLTNAPATKNISGSPIPSLAEYRREVSQRGSTGDTQIQNVCGSTADVASWALCEFQRGMQTMLGDGPTLGSCLAVFLLGGASLALMPL